MKKISIIISLIIFTSCSSGKIITDHRLESEFVNTNTSVFDIVEASSESEVNEELDDLPSYRSIRYYYRKNGGVYKICSDSDGKVLVTSNGQRITYGRGYKIKDIKIRYGLGRYYNRVKSRSSCRNF